MNIIENSQECMTSFPGKEAITIFPTAKNPRAINTAAISITPVMPAPAHGAGKVAAP